MVIEKEAQAIKWALKALHYNLLRSPFIVMTDHPPQKWLKQMKDTNAWLMCWYLFLQTFTFTVQHQASKENSNADTLSWLGEGSLISYGGLVLGLRGIV